MSVPRLTPEEKRRALEKARWVRSERAKLKSQLKQGTVSLAEVLEKDDDAVIAGMPVRQLLESLPRIGKVTCERLMDEIGIDRARRVRGLGVRQRSELLKKLG
ncbi:MAG TPA: integration host factor [Firmicutes bacterium]|nr:integration host factor [Bacillota bacterium]